MSGENCCELLHLIGAGKAASHNVMIQPRGRVLFIEVLIRFDHVNEFEMFSFWNQLSGD